jgi:ketosteroid isomerase-like protein
MSQNNVQVIQQAYGNFRTGNIGALIDQMDDRVVWDIPSIANVRISGRREGRNRVLEFFQYLGADQESVAFEPREFFSQGDKVVTLGHYDWIVKGTSKRWGGDFVHVFTVRDGKVVHFQEYLDTAAVAEAYKN